MKSFLDYAKTTIYRGVIFLIPITIIIYITKDIYSNIYIIVAPIAISLGAEKFFGKIAVMFIAIIVLLLICFIVGLIIKLGFAKRIHDKLDSIAATFIPGYKLMKTESIMQLDKKILDKTVNAYDDWDSVMIKLNKEWKIVFIIEESGNGLLTIFEPGSPISYKDQQRLYLKVI